ncbi:hypothetical protein [Achromobacter insuavis]|uniref:hypothetical protein n=1 Tax=Achromobacter insuavis TaxID=1287735 RepID=UPI001EEA7A3D|nr:hypothetical protein [Achromobacter insuavis]
MTVRVICDNPGGLSQSVYDTLRSGDEVGTWKLTGPANARRLEFQAAQWKGAGTFGLHSMGDELHCIFRWETRPEENRVLHCWAAHHTDLAQMFLVHFKNVAIDVRIAPPTEQDLEAK